MIEWNINPDIVRFGPVPLRWYSLCWALGLLGAYGLFARLLKKENRPQFPLDSLFVYVFVGALAGARLGECLLYEFGYYSKHLWEIILPLHRGAGGGYEFGYTGLASHGGAVGLLAGVLLFSYRNKEDLLWLLDRLALVVPLAGAFIRLGNFMNSEIVGLPSLAPWAVVFSRVDALPRHPAQLYEATAYLLISGGLYWLYARGRFAAVKGNLFGAFLVTLFGSRFLIEFVKARQEAFEYGMSLDMGQLLSLPFIAYGVFLLARNNKRSTA